jgi:hypothetical protein
MSQAEYTRLLLDRNHNRHRWGVAERAFACRAPAEA